MRGGGLCTLTSNCGIVGFYSPSVTGTYWNNVASIVGGHISKRGIGADRHTLRSSNRGFWIDGHQYLEGLTYAIAIRSGSGGDGVGDRLNGVGGVRECLRNGILGSGLVSFTRDIVVGSYRPGIGGIRWYDCTSPICRRDVKVFS